MANAQGYIYSVPLTHFIDTEPLYTKAIQNVVGRYGKVFTWNLKVKIMGTHREDASKTVVKELGLPITWQEYDKMIQEQYDIVLSDPDIFPGE